MASLLGLPAAEWCRRRQDGSFRHWLIERYAPEEPDAPATMPVAEAIGEMTAHLSLYEGLGHAA
ncbi:hypothetical protein [Jiella marina]|uniref:hypothetical protein n=1 Tax=Jiella sp. LLJ827 TaxID=2917712 RepID=UPI002100BB64|nr:hypothetical protein [Jiella sp. LLJ827]MCQ0988996.1 hypothetical protein [Jiella sp. LLJ827]